MPIDLVGRQVFLASPGDMSLERSFTREVITDFNATRAHRESATFLIRGWEQVPPGIGRPQGRINPHMDDCDYMVLLLGYRWGSSTDTDGRYTSGTEEEFFYCLDLLASESAVMRDVLVLLRVLEPDRVADPGAQLTRVLDFRKRLEQSKRIQYGVFDSNDKLRLALEGALDKWSRPLEPREPTHIELPAGDFDQPTAGLSTRELLERARQHHKDGMSVQADGLYALAIQDGDPEALSAYAQFSRRTGNLDLALDLNARLIRDPRLLIASDAESIRYRVNSLANMGVIRRKRGDIAGSLEVLREAVELAERSGHTLTREHCYALDNDGFSLMRAGRFAKAAAQFKRAYDLRAGSGDAYATAQSAINLGRVSLQVGEFLDAEGHFAEAVENLDPETGKRELANAHCGIAEARLRNGTTLDVEAMLDTALDLNEETRNSDGISICHGMRGRLALQTDDLERALRESEMCASEARKSGNLVGNATALWLQAQVAFRRGDLASALDYIDEATEDATRSQDDLLLRDIADTRKEVLSAMG